MYYYSQIIQQLSKKNNFQRFIAKGLNIEGFSYSLRSNHLKAIESFKKTLNIANRLDDKKAIAVAFNNISKSHYKLGNYDQAIEFSNKSIEIKEEIGDQIGIGTAYNGLGNIYLDRGDLANAIDYFTKALNIHKKAKNKIGIATNLSDIGLVYLYQEKDWDKAIEYFYESLELSKKLNNEHSLANNLKNLGIAFEYQHKIHSAIDFHLKSLAIRKELQDPEQIIESYNHLGNNYIALKDYNKALEYFVLSDSLYKRSYNLKYNIYTLMGLSKVYFYKSQAKFSMTTKSDSIISSNIALNNALKAFNLSKSRSLVKEIKDSAFILYEIYQSKKDFETALKYYKIFDEMKDELLKEENRNEIIKQEFKSEYERLAILDRAKENERMKREELKRIVAYLSLLLCLLLLAILWTRYSKSQKQKSVIQSTLSKLKDTQNKLVESEKMAALGVLTAGIAHEINNPVNFISNGLNILKNRFNQMAIMAEEFMDLSEDSNDFKEKIKSLKKTISESELEEEIKDTLVFMDVGVKRTTDIIQGLSLYARSEKSELEKANIHKIIDSALVILNNKFKGRIKIEKKYDNSIKKISCYPSQLNQVFINLLGNSMDAIPKKGTITIDTVFEGDTIAISIRDTGLGIKEDIKDKIYDPFFTTKGIGKGTGLGLSICQGIINNHKGTMTFSSKLNEGTEFVIKLPLELNND
ncbi:tetratricopeptide repeat protein [Winogradskyella sp.]